MGKSGFDVCVGITRLTMRINGVWPGDDSNKNWYSRYYVLLPLFFMLFFVNIPQTRMLFHVGGDLNDTLEILTTADVIIALACLKLLEVWYNKQDLRYLLVEIEKDWMVMEEYKQRIMWENVKLSKCIITSYVVLTYSTVILYGMGMLLLMNSQATQDQNIENITISRLTFLKSKFFFDTQSSPIFETVWFFQFFTGIIATGAFTSFDGFFIFSILHLCAQLSSLQFDLRNLIVKCRFTKQSFVQLLSTIVKRHIHLRRFTYRIEKNFNEVFLVQMICYSVTICLQGYQLVISLTENSKHNAATLAFILVYTVANILSLFVYCFVAEKLRIESTNIFYAAYDMDWVEIQSKESRMLVNIMHATKAPLQITAGKFAVLSFEYFVKVLKTAMGYLSMLLAVKSGVQA